MNGRTAPVAKGEHNISFNAGDNPTKVLIFARVIAAASRSKGIVTCGMVVHSGGDFNPVSAVTTAAVHVSRTGMADRSILCPAGEVICPAMNGSDCSASALLHLSPILKAVS